MTESKTKPVVWKFGLLLGAIALIVVSIVLWSGRYSPDPIANAPIEDPQVDPVVESKTSTASAPKSKPLPEGKILPALVQGFFLTRQLMSSRQIVVHPDGRIVRSDSGDFDLQDDSSPRLEDLELSVSLLAPSELSKLQALASAPISTSDDGEISLRIDGRAQVARIDASTDDSVTRTILRIFGMTTSDGQRIAESGASAILPIVQIVWREASGEWDALLVYPDARVEYQLLSSEKIDLEGVGIAKLLELAPEEFAPLQNALEQWNAAQSNYLAANWSLRKNEPGMLVISSRQGPTFKVRRKGQLPAELKRVLSLAQQLRVRFSMKGN